MRALAPLAVLASLALPLEAGALVHVARTGETLEQLAARYYGDPSSSMVIRAANGFVHPDDGRLIQGERVEIPEVVYHRVRTGETWESLADRYLGTARRGRALAELNDGNPGAQPAAGTIVKIPFQLLYILAPGESAQTVVRDYLRSERSAEWLRAYNLDAKARYGRGDALLVPLADVEISEEERARTEEAGGPQFTVDDQRAQRAAIRRIESMRIAFAEGRYLEIVATGHGLLGTGRVTVPQQIGVYKYLAFAYVALGERAEALGCFARALELQPVMELSPITTSPKILEVFQEARKRAAAASPPAKAAGAEPTSD